MAGVLSTLSIISFAVAGVALALAIVSWFFFEIPTVIGDLSGRTAKKSIAKMRAENERTGVKKYKESNVNRERGKLTETMSGMKGKSQEADSRTETGLLVENKAASVEKEETGLLSDKTTAPLDAGETVLLADKNETVALGRNAPAEKRTGGKTLTILEEVMLIHTDEVIEC